MTRPDEPDPYELADDHDELDWDSTVKPGTRDGEGVKRMRMFHSGDDAVATVPYVPGDAA